MTRFTLSIFILLFAVIYAGCIFTGPKVIWSENLAIQANSKDVKMHDDNIYTAGESSPLISDRKDKNSVEEADKYTHATLSWVQTQKIEKIVIKSDEGQLEFFEALYADDEGNWKSLRSVRDNLKTAYSINMLGKPIMTKAIRLKIPRRWDSRRVGGQKRRTRGETGAPQGTSKKIREIEVYHSIAPEPEMPSTEE
ncbi:TPA: hypothetical protein EYO57_27370 [Candidatus Poribacteria bacterium]|nr:hypothetical protein [Candidatus Poribacteria bacterium]